MIAFSAELKYPQVPHLPSALSSLQFCSAGSGNHESRENTIMSFVPVPRRFRHSAKRFRTLPLDLSVKTEQILLVLPTRHNLKMPTEAGICMQFEEILTFYIN